jgi:hypothetical protein
VNGDGNFALFDCNLVRCATGRRCSNLREFLDALRTVPDRVLEHHMMRCPLEDHFELHEFPNDFALWCWDALGDHLLAEQLGLADPYGLPTIAALREELVNAVEERLWGMEVVPWCRPGLSLHMVESRLVAYDTGERITTPAALMEGIGRMSTRSLYYHVHEARRRTRGESDDFTLWLTGIGAEPSLVARIRAVDFYFLNLTQLRQALLDAFQQRTEQASAIPRSTTT